MPDLNSLTPVELPSFHHAEIRELYRHGLRIDQNVLKNILALPQESLLQDLETVLQDSINRFDFFQEKLEKENEWLDKELSFPLHALFLLTELRATEKLPLLLHQLRQERKFLDFWYSDHLTETIWHFIYHLGSGELESLKSFMFEPGVSYVSKWAVMSGVTQIGRWHPERREEVIGWYELLTDFFIENHENFNLADPEVVSSLVCELYRLNASGLLPKIKLLYEHDLIYEGIPGTYQSIERDIFKENESGIYKVFENIFDHYTHITTTWYGYMSEEQKKEREDKFRREIEQKHPKLRSSAGAVNTGRDLKIPVKREGPKPSRNAPCPCGSGKKYKHCCGRSLKH